MSRPNQFYKQLLFIVVGIAILAAGGVAIYGVNNRGADPVAWWKFDEGYASTTYDASGSNDGTLTGGVQWKNEDECKQGKCLFLDGGDDYVSVGNINKDIQTISFWLRPASTTDGVIELVNNTNYVSIINSTLTTTGFTSPIIYVNGIANKTSLTLNQWNFVAMTTSSAVLASGVVIGEANNKYFTGYIDDVRLYDYARSASQIKADYLASAGGKGASVKVGSAEEFRSASEGLVAYWKMDEEYWPATSAVVLDSSGNSNTGTTAADATSTATAKFGRAGTFDGTGDYVSVSNTITGVQTVEFWLQDANATDGILELINNSTYISIASNAITATGFTAPAIYIDGQLTSSLPASGWHHIALVTNTAVSATGINIGEANNDYLSGQIDDVKIYKTARSASQIRRDYETGPPPVAHWRIDENGGSTVYDTSGNGNNGTLDLGGSTPTKSAWVSGKFGSALSFDGTDDYVDAGSDSSLNITGALSIAAWVMTTETGRGEIYTRWVNSSPYPGYGLSMHNDYGCNDPGQVGIWVGDNPSRYLCSTGVAINDGVWHFLVGTYDGTTAKIYIDGKLNNSGARTNGLNSSATPYIGGKPGVAYFDGIIDDVRIYNYARTQKQILEDMNAGHPAVGSPVGSYVGYWPFDEGYGTTAYDKSTNANNLTLSTTSAWTTAGKFGRAFANTYGKQNASRTDDPDFDFAATEDFSVSMWFKSNSATNPSEIEYLIRKADGSAGWAIYLATTTGQVGFATDDDTTWSPDDSAVSTDDFYDATWHHAVGVKTGTTSLELFVDGVSRASDTSISGDETLANSVSLYIGDSTGSDSGDEFNGIIDEVKIYRFALSPEEVKQEYNSGATLKLGSLSAPPTGGAGAGTSTDSALLEYCVPGGTDQCDPPVAHWKFDERSGSTLYDTVGTNHGDLNLDSSPATTSAWKSAGSCHAGSCLSFDGVDDYVSIGRLTEIEGADISWSIMGWFRYDTTSGNRILFVYDANDIGHTDDLYMYWNSSADQLKYQIGGGAAEKTSSITDLEDGKWHHIAMVKDGANTSIYEDGVLNTGPVAYAGGNFGAGWTFRIGDNVNINHWLGLIDDVRIYNYARSAAQIAYDYNRGKPVGWWKMDEGQDTATTCDATGSTVYDYSGNGNNGDLNLDGSPATSSAWSEGKFNCALDFDGTDDYVDISSASLSDGNWWTASVWIKADSLPSRSLILNNYYESNGFRLMGDDVDFWPRIDNGNSYSVSKLDVLQTGTWYHLAMSVGDGGYVKGYINGELVAQSSALGGGATTELSGVPFRIGAEKQTAGDYFDGIIDDVKIWNYALTKEQIKMDYNQGAAVRFGPSSGLP